MIFGSENISTYSRSNMAIWMTLAFQAGLLNVGGFLAARTFVSHVTGFATLASIEMDSGRAIQFLGYMALPLAFLLGSIASGLLVDLRIKLKKKPKYYLVFGFMFFVTLVIAIGGFNEVFGDFGKPPRTLNGYALVTLLCFVCGVQNGTITLVSKSVVRTTHLTGVTTDLGIGIVRYFNRRRIKDVESEGKANLMRAGIILFLSLGHFWEALCLLNGSFAHFLSHV